MARLTYVMIGNQITYYLPDAAECAAFQKQVEAMAPPDPLDDGDDERTQALHAWDERNKAKPAHHLAEAERLLSQPPVTQVDLYQALLQIIAYLKERG